MSPASYNPETTSCCPTPILAQTPIFRVQMLCLESCNFVILYPFMCLMRHLQTSFALIFLRWIGWALLQLKAKCIPQFVCNLPLSGHILIYGPPGSGKSLLAKASAKYTEGCKDILAHM